MAFPDTLCASQLRGICTTMDEYLEFCVVYLIIFFKLLDLKFGSENMYLLITFVGVLTVSHSAYALVQKDGVVCLLLLNLLKFIHLCIGQTPGAWMELMECFRVRRERN